MDDLGKDLRRLELGRKGIEASTWWAGASSFSVSPTCLAGHSQTWLDMQCRRAAVQHSQQTELSNFRTSNSLILFCPSLFSLFSRCANSRLSLTIHHELRLHKTYHGCHLKFSPREGRGSPTTMTHKKLSFPERRLERCIRTSIMASIQ